MLIDCKPKELSCVAYFGDLRKGEKVQEILEQTKNENYKLICGNLANKDLFKNVISNLFYWLKPNGKIFFIDKEFYKGFEVKSDYIFMG